MKLLLFFALMLAPGSGCLSAQGSQADQLRQAAERSRQMEASLEKDPFVGITSDGKVAPDLFKIESTGASTDSIRLAAGTFLNSLSKSQREKTLLPVDDNEWRSWMNQHFYDRAGVGFEEMTENQRELALNLLKASLSEEGFQLARNIMKLNYTLGEIKGDMFMLGEWAYFITIMGQPSATEPWGWQIDGHHLIINFFVLGDQVVATPTFVGSEPVVVETGKYAGIEILQDEQNHALTFAQSLTPAQRAKAILTPDKTGNDNQTEAFSDNVVIPYEGLPVKELDKKQTKALQAVITLYIDQIREPHARIRMAEILSRWDETYFAWKGKTDEDSVFYYRIHSPVVLIEFDHQNPVGLRKQFPERTPIRQHVHAVVRTPNGNDYGKDLLRLHLEKYHHSE